MPSRVHLTLEQKIKIIENAEKCLFERLPKDPKDIYNCDETGLYFRGMPDRGYVPGSEK